MTTRMATITRPFASRSGSGPTKIRRLFDATLEWRARGRERHALRQLDDRMLRDIGLSRGDVYRETTKSFWQA